MAREMKDSGIKWIGSIPTTWEVRRVKNGFIRKNEKAMIDDPVVLSLARTGVRVRNMENAEGQFAESYFNYNPVEPGDLLLNPMDLYSGANCSISKVSGVISPAYMNLKSKSGYCPEYYDYYFKTQYWAMAMFAHGKGVSFDNRWTINAEDLFKYYIPYPSYSEQCRVAAFLDRKCAEIDSVIASTQRTIEEYKALKQSIITEAVTKGVRGKRPMKDSGIEWIGEVPTEWKILSLSQVTSSMRNGYVGPTKDLFVDEGVRYIQSLHVKDGAIIFSNGEYYVRPEWAQQHPKIHTDDILIVQTCDIGQVGLVLEEFDNCNCHALIIATPDKTVIKPKYLTYYLRSVVGKELLLFYKTGALLPHLNSGKIKFAAITCPLFDEQSEIITYLDNKCTEVDKLIVAKEQLLRELESYKKSVIYEYVTGKKEVPACQ